MRYEESAVLELKEQVNADFKKEIIAFANTDGGEIFVGVAKDGSITGVENAEAEMDRQHDPGWHQAGPDRLHRH